MRIRVLLDLHLEFEDWNPPRADAEVVVLAGDIHVGETLGSRRAQWAEYCLERSAVPWRNALDGFRSWGVQIQTRSIARWPRLNSADLALPLRRAREQLGREINPTPGQSYLLTTVLHGNPPRKRNSTICAPSYREASRTLPHQLFPNARPADSPARAICITGRIRSRSYEGGLADLAGTANEEGLAVLGVEPVR